MKISKKSLSYHFIGLFLCALYIISGVIIHEEWIMLLGMFALCILFILGIEIDLYKKKEK